MMSGCRSWRTFGGRTRLTPPSSSASSATGSSLQSSEHEEFTPARALGRMYRTGGAFSSTVLPRSYLNTPMRGRYWRDALQSYKSLFPDMDTFIEELVVKLRSKGFRIP